MPRRAGDDDEKFGSDALWQIRARCRRYELDSLLYDRCVFTKLKTAENRNIATISRYRNFVHYH